MKLARYAALSLAALLLLAASAHAQEPEKRVQVHFINVGQADATLLEFKTAAVLIDAGGENTGEAGTAAGDRDLKRLTGYLDAFFARRRDLRRTIHSVIVTHPHIDHTKLLVPVIRRYRVLNLVDGGGTSGSGIGPLRDARALARARGAVYNRVTDARIGREGYAPAMLARLNAAEPDLDIRLLTGARGCENQNNNSVTVRVAYKGRKFFFPGDSEEEDSICAGGQIAHLVEKYDNETNTGLLDVDVYKVGHHGSRNGTTEEMLTAMSPRVAVISAGDSETRAPERFHAYFFGHPRESAVKMVEEQTADTRTPPSNGYTMRAVKRVIRPRPVDKAVYCTCWDSNIVIEVREDGSLAAPRTNQ